MYINSEKDLEDYICNNMEEFIVFLKEIFGKQQDIEFVGRQVIIGNSRIDLLFKKTRKDSMEYQTYIVVELKYREIEPKDVSQLSKYMNLLYNLDRDERIGKVDICVQGLLLGTGLDSETQEIEMYLDNYTDAEIRFAQINTKVEYDLSNYSRREEFIKNMIIDDRLKTSREVETNGKEEND